ncbi:protein phosphatase 2C-like domain-containing protein 1 [Ochotona princeps]|uniref:protein phosphatase 2C-like domain-containing protein 1 n=1 Tax=Ochotona princeps TaxID=9978 RepID=UPI00271486F8|nr:protein phosphatase 2C-like domain-containing protein 1 [Ochotona princeps]
MEINSALRVFWKQRKWNLRKSIFDSDVNLSLRKRSSKKKKAKFSKKNKDAEEQSASDHVITFPCSTCKQEIDIRGAFGHKKQHVALATLGFQWLGGKMPWFLAIASHRQFIISKVMSSFIFSEKILQIINDAFELLRKKQIPGYYKILDSTDRSSTTSHKVCHLLIKGVAICEDMNSTWRHDMNDKFTVLNHFGNKPNVCFFGLFDGCHGAAAADLAATELPVLFLHQLSNFDPSYQMTQEQQKMIHSFHTVFRKEYTALEDLFSSTHKRTRGLKNDYENIHKAFAKAFWRMDRLLRLGRNEVSRVRWSGCSAVTCVLEGSIKNPHVQRSWKGSSNHDEPADSSSSPTMPQLVSGVLHIANTGNVQAVLCRNGKGFCLTKEHTTRNTNERNRVLQNGAVITSNEPYGLLEGEIEITRGLGFHGNLRLKKFFIPAPQTISVPVDDLCQFLILATNGLWEVLDKKEVIALTITEFQMYKDTHDSTMQNKCQPPIKSLLFPVSAPSTTASEGHIHVLFECKLETNERVSTTDSNDLSSFKHSEYPKHNYENGETFPPEKTNPEADREGEAESCTDGGHDSDKQPGTGSFYDSAAEHVSRKLVRAALSAGSRDNITVMVVFLNGISDDFLHKAAPMIQNSTVCQTRIQ